MHVVQKSEYFFSGGTEAIFSPCIQALQGSSLWLLQSRSLAGFIQGE